MIQERTPVRGFNGFCHLSHNPQDTNSKLEPDIKPTFHPQENIADSVAPFHQSTETEAHRELQCTHSFHLLVYNYFN